ncbi:LuxR C-terminal-related transcriptional regulator [Streptomyces sp. NPDC051636]|uniref:helix-turn-helix transcriptional regulator n=1 Tax=Streptomyces sp. NPDC051636 TaxID=3365663 RepID=UPI0037A0F24F
MSQLFSRRELQVIAGYARGDTGPQIAVRLGLSPSTIKTINDRAATRVRDTGKPAVRHPVLVDYAYRTGQLEGLKPEERGPIRLTRRQQQCLDGYAEGLTAEQQAAALGVTKNTVHTLRVRLLRQLGAKTAAHAVALAWQYHLLADQGTLPRPACPTCGRR